jgi:hypothetical protein
MARLKPCPSFRVFLKFAQTCGYVKGIHEALVPGIPGLKNETWGTLRVFPTL